MSVQNNDFRVNVLQGEILSLLHDLGKLGRLFVSSATEGAEKNVYPTNAHTLLFLAGASPDLIAEKGKKINNACVDLLQDRDKLPPLQKLLSQKINWLNLPNAGMACLGSLLGLHHHIAYKDVRDILADCKGDEYPEAMLLAMYADTSDSAFSKGNSSSEETTQRSSIHLACPQGGVDHEISAEDLEADSKALGEAIIKWAGGDFANWSDADTLVKKRNELRDILRLYGSRHMAETRLPNNDVSLWQHSYSVSAIFKAMLSSYLASGDWSGLLAKGNLVHSKQRLAMLAVQWDENAYLERSTRPFEIIGRKARLHKLAEAIKELVEDRLCLGNEIYRDSKGICFMVPDLPYFSGQSQEWASQTIASLKDEINSFCNGGILDGDIRWQIFVQQTGLRMTSMLDFWNTPEKAILIASNSGTPAWQQSWQGAEGKQVCPRCGLRPVPWTASRTGGDGDEGLCRECQKLREEGHKVLRAFGDLDNTEAKRNNATSFARTAFGINTPYSSIRDFWEGKDSDSGDNRLALVQGVMPLDSIYDGSFFDLLLMPCGEEWDKLHARVKTAWQTMINGDDAKAGEAISFFIGSFGSAGDGWCSDAEPGKYQARWIDNMVFGGADKRPAGIDEQVTRIITWALRQHPAPSRMARMWNQVRDYMRSAFAIANDRNIDFVPLTCDSGTFQILVRAGKAMELLRIMREEYVSRFGRVRHLLPLHLSASIFYHKAPLYIAMDAARRFRNLATMPAQKWTLEEKLDEREATRLVWKTGDGKKVVWSVPNILPDKRRDAYHTWFMVDGLWHPVSLFDLRKGQVCIIRQSSFDFEVLDASTRRYDIRYNSSQAGWNRPHFMLPAKVPGPRPYPLEVLSDWEDYEKLFTGNSSQMKIALELVARLHHDWNRNEEAFAPMIRDVLVTTLGVESAERLLPMAVDGSFFDLFEWFDFIAC